MRAEEPAEAAVRPLYGRFGWAYDRVVPSPAGGSAEHLGAMLVSQGVQRGDRVVDAGCGTGRYAAALAALGFDVIGVDRSEALIDEARKRDPAIAFHRSDLLAWSPGPPVAAVLCRGVLNDLTDDGDRHRAFQAFASWLRPAGTLLADVRDWEATAARYASGPVHRHSVDAGDRRLDFRSETDLDPGRRLMRVRERYRGSVDGVEIEEEYEFEMRCWTPQEVRRLAEAAGFATLDLKRGEEAGIAADRLLVVAVR